MPGRRLAAAALGLRFLRRTGILAGFRPRALAALLAELRGRPPGRHHALHLHALSSPDRLALVFHRVGARRGEGEVRLTYGALDRRSRQLASALDGAGLARGAAVALMLRNCPEQLEVQAATPYLGATTVHVGYRLKAGEVAYILEHSRAGALLFGAEHGEVVRAAVAQAGLPPARAFSIGGAVEGFPGYEELLARGDPAGPPPQAAGDGGGLMVYTSGTTGRPKGARRSLASTGVEPILDMLTQVPLRRDERHLTVCPLYHSAAQAFSAFVLLLGGTIVLLDHFDAEAALDAIERERVTSSFMVPTMYSRLLELGSAARRARDLSSLRCLVTGAAPLPTALAARIEEAFGPILFNFYGATETGAVTLACPGEHLARPGTIGRALSGNELRLLDPEGRPVADGDVGELWVRSPMLVGGYERDEAATRAASRDGFFSVGDLGRRDADGYYYLVDRVHDMVISGGVNIYPLEIEDRLQSHPAVVEAAVVGVPHPDWGEALRAYVVLRQGQVATAEELRAWVGAELADFKRPREVVYLSELPRNATGKVLRRELRARALGPELLGPTT